MQQLLGTELMSHTVTLRARVIEHSLKVVTSNNRVNASVGVDKCV